MTNNPIIENKPNINARLPKHSIELVIGKWARWFDSEKTKLLIVEALNEWTANEERLELNGYFITDYSVYLLVKVAKSSFHKKLSIFYEIVIKLIEQSHNYSKRNYIDDLEFLDSKPLHHLPFEKRIFLNHDLIRLMLGKKIYSTYYDLEQVYLINNIKHYNYCSAIDYSGAISPVHVTLLQE